MDDEEGPLGTTPTTRISTQPLESRDKYVCTHHDSGTSLPPEERSRLPRFVHTFLSLFCLPSRLMVFYQMNRPQINILGVHSGTPLIADSLIPHHSFLRSSSQHPSHHVSSVTKEGQEELRGREGGWVVAASGAAGEQEQEQRVLKRSEIRRLNPPLGRICACGYAGTLARCRA